MLYLTGYSPYPPVEDDSRPTHVIERLDKKIYKTALGAEKIVPFKYEPDVKELIAQLKQDEFEVVGLEQVFGSVPLDKFQPTGKCALLLGEEVSGIPEDLQPLCDEFVEIPMRGQKRSFNVSVATGMALYALRHAKVKS